MPSPPFRHVGDCTSQIGCAISEILYRRARQLRHPLPALSFRRARYKVRAESLFPSRSLSSSRTSWFHCSRMLCHLGSETPGLAVSIGYWPSLCDQILEQPVILLSPISSHSRLWNHAVVPSREGSFLIGSSLPGGQGFAQQISYIT